MENVTGNRIKELRKELNLTQEGLGNILHVTKQSVSKWERGTNIPEPPILKQLANMFNCSTDYLLGTTDIKSYSDNLFSGTGALTKEDITLTKKDEKDIEKATEEFLKGLEGGAMLNGEILDEEDLELFKQAVKNGLTYAKISNKKKYTPKKYRKENE